MSTPAETLHAMIEALTEEKSVARRRTHANAAYVALRQLREALPFTGAQEAEEAGYQRGSMDAVLLAKTALEKHEGHVRAAQKVAGEAYGVLGGVLNYGQMIISTFETLAQRAATDSYKRQKGKP